MPVQFPIFLLFLLTVGISYETHNPENISATIVEKNQCIVNTGNSILGLGVLDPQTPADKVVSTSFRFKCPGPGFRIDFSTGDNVDLSGAERKMRHADLPDSNLPYTFSVDRTESREGRGFDQVLNVSVKVKGESYRDLYAGSYSDVLYISVAP